MIDPQFAAFLQEGLAVHIGTRNQHLEPNGARAIALTVEDDGSRSSCMSQRSRSSD